MADATQQVSIVARLVDEMSGPMTRITTATDRLADVTIEANDPLQGLEERVNAALDAVVEFGGSVEDQADALSAMADAADRTGEPLTNISAALAKLVDEASDGAAGAENLGRAMDLMAAANLRAEDAGAAVGQVLRGEVDVLRQLGPAASAAADRIEAIRDPQLRAEAAVRALDQALARQSSALQRVRDRWNAWAATHPTAVQGLQLVGAAVAAVAVAIGATLVKAVGTYMSQNSRLIKSQKDLERAWDDLLYQIGEVIAQSLKLEEGQRALTGAIEEVGKWVKDNEKKIAEWVKALGVAAVGAVKLVANIALGIGMLVAAVIDGINILISNGMGTIGELLIAVNGPLFEMGAISLQTSQDMAALGRSIRDAGKAGSEVDFPITEQLVGIQEQANATLDAITAALEGGGGSGGPQRRGRRIRPGSGGGTNSERERLKQLAAEQSAEAATGDLFGDLDSQLGKLNEIIEAKDRQARVEQRVSAATRETDAATRELEAAYTSIIEGPLQDLLQGTYQIVDALATASMTVSDVKVAFADLGGDIIGGLGLDLISEAIGEFASRLGKVFTAMGITFEALSSNPLALAGAGIALVGAAVLLKKFAGSGSLTPSRARSADGQAAATMERLGRDLFGQSEREDRAFNLFIADYEPLRGMMSDHMSDVFNRGMFRVNGTGTLSRAVT